MLELYKIQKDQTIEKLSNNPFEDEAYNFEKFLIENEELLGDVMLLGHQVTLPDQTRIDIWGFDFLERTPIVVELKNIKTGLEVIHQILPYYNFVKLNPDVLKSRALQDKKFLLKINALDINQEGVNDIFKQDPKILIVAPEFKTELLEVVDYISFGIELIQIQRYRDENQTIYIGIERPQALIKEPQTVRVQKEWDWEKYQDIYSKKKVKLAKALKEKLDEIVKENEIPVEPVFRKGYIPYKYGRRNIMWIDLNYTSWETGDVVIGFTLEDEIDLESEGIEIDISNKKWSKDYSHYSLFFNKETELITLTPIIKKAFFNITGNKI